MSSYEKKSPNPNSFIEFFHPWNSEEHPELDLRHGGKSQPGFLPMAKPCREWSWGSPGFHGAVIFFSRGKVGLWPLGPAAPFRRFRSALTARRSVKCARKLKKEIIEKEDWAHDDILGPLHDIACFFFIATVKQNGEIEKFGIQCGRSFISKTTSSENLPPPSENYHDNGKSPF